MENQNKGYWIDLGLGAAEAPADGESTISDIDDLLAQIASTPSRRVALYMHGGLVPVDSGRAVATKLRPSYEQTGVKPIFFIWRTGVVETFQRNLSQLAMTQFFKKQWVHLESLVNFCLPADSEARRGGPDDRKFLSDFTDPENQALLEELTLQCSQMMEEDCDFKRDAAEVNLWTPEDGARSVSLGLAASRLAQAAFNVARRFCLQTDHGYLCTLTEEFLRALFLDKVGRSLWQRMKTVAEEMWRQEEKNTAALGRVQASYFIRKLASLRTQIPDLTVDLVGHSAGSIVICELLKTVNMSYPDLCFRNVVFLAPACTTELFYDSVVSRPNLFQTFRMFAMEDKYECKDRLSILYERSLLYLVSGLLENDAPTPIAGLERYSRQDHKALTSNQENVRFFLRDDKWKRLVLSVSDGGPGYASAATTHGGFGEEEKTLASVKTLLGAH